MLDVDDDDAVDADTDLKEVMDGWLDGWHLDVPDGMAVVQ